MCYLNHKTAFSFSWQAVLKSIQLSITNTMVSFVLVAEEYLLILASLVLLHTVRKNVCSITRY